MRLTAILPLLLLIGLAGCAAPRKNGSRRAEAADDRVAGRVESPAAPSPASRSKPVTKPEGEPVALPAYEVRESAFTDFGMSVKTNLAVKWGDAVEWMEVSAVMPGSSAAKQNLRPGDRILALDGELITKFGRDSMLAALFQRQGGGPHRVAGVESAARAAALRDADCRARPRFKLDPRNFPRAVPKIFSFRPRNFARRKFC